LPWIGLGIDIPAEVDLKILLLKRHQNTISEIVAAAPEVRVNVSALKAALR
jgi:hypothetical protein